MVKNLFYLLVLLAGFPVALFLSKLCYDEIKNWKKRLIIISIISLAGAVGISFINFNYKFPIIINLFFIIIVCLTIVWKSHK